MKFGFSALSQKIHRLVSLLKCILVPETHDAVKGEDRSPLIDLEVETTLPSLKARAECKGKSGRDENINGSIFSRGPLRERKVNHVRVIALALGISDSLISIFRAISALIGAWQSSESIHLPWWRWYIVGYVVSPLLVGMMTLARLFVSEPLFVWAPFCLIVVMVGFLWGTGPALLTMMLAILAINYVVIPQYELLTLNIWNDITLLGPFVVVQILIILLAAQNAVSYRRILAAKREVQAYAQTLVETNRQLERTNRLKDYFFTRAAHELRTPLTIILGEVQLALRRLDKAEKTTTDMAVWRTHFEMIEVRVHGLHSLVEDLIELYSLRSEETHLRLTTCDIRDLCNEIIEEQRLLTGRQIELQLPPEPIIIQADCERFRQVIVNMVDNAVKYAPENTTVQVRVHTEPARAIIEIHNEDSELSQEQQERIFEPFYRTPSAEASFKEGWGLGLTISKECVERHGGRIWVESSEQGGVTFFVELPSLGSSNTLPCL